MGKTNYLQRVNTLLKDNVSKLITASKLRTVLNTGYDDILEDIEILSKIKVFETLQDIESYASSPSGVYVGQILVLKGNPSIGYVVNQNRSVSPLASNLSEKEDLANKINSFNETPSPYHYPSERLLVNALRTKADLENGVIVSSQLPSYINSVIEVANFATLPTTGLPNKIYITIDNGIIYRWDGTVYAEISKSIGIGETANTAYRGDRGKTAYDHSQTTHAPANAQKNSDITPEEVAAKLPASIETTTSLGDIINGAYAKGTPITNDMFVIRDSVTGLLQKVPLFSLRDNMRMYLEQFFPSSFKTINEQSILGTGNITISEGSGGTTPETVISMGDLINSSSDKTPPVDADVFAIRDSVTGLLKKLSFSNLRFSLKTYFDTIYNYYTHPANHPASVITQDSSNRFVSDIEKATWNGKSNFSGAYNDLSGKPSFKTINGTQIIGEGNIEISAGSGTSTPETATSMGILINTTTEKTTPVDADMFSIRDSVSGFLQKLSLSNLKSVLKTYFDTLYNNYTHPANHSPSVITQDSSNRFVSDAEKTTWNNKSTFSGNYSDLSGKPTIPTALSQLSEDSTHKHITEAEKNNIPKNAALVQDFSQPNITIDFSSYDIQEDGHFDANTAITTGNKDITITNPILNKVVTILLPKISEGTVIRLPEGCKKLTGDYNDTLQNIVMIHCTKTSPARYLYTISQIQA